MANPTPALTPEVLWKHIDYDKDTGILTLKPNAPHPKIKQYLTDCICIDGRNYSFTRLSYYMHHAHMPKKIVKVNSDIFDIRIENLQAYVPKQVQEKPRTTTPVQAPPPRQLSALERNRIEAVRLKEQERIARQQAKRRERYELSKTLFYRPSQNVVNIDKA